MDAKPGEALPYGPMPMESAIDWFDRRAAQASALAKLTYGEAGETFRNYNDEIQESAMWLLGDLIDELRHAHAAAMKEREQWAAKNPDRVRERGHPGH